MPRSAMREDVPLLHRSRPVVIMIAKTALSFGRGVGQGAGIEVKDCARVSAELVARFKAATARWARKLRPSESRRFHSHADVSTHLSR